MSQSMPSFWDSPFFVPEPDNWHLTEDAPEELKKEFAEYMKEKGKNLATKEDIEEITLVGLCTDICVISNALLVKAYLPEVPVAVLQDCCAGVTPESHKNALEAMKMCQIEVR